MFISTSHITATMHTERDVSMGVAKHTCIVSATICCQFHGFFPRAVQRSNEYHVTFFDLVPRKQPNRHLPDDQCFEEFSFDVCHSYFIPFCATHCHTSHFCVPTDEHPSRGGVPQPPFDSKCGWYFLLVLTPQLTSLHRTAMRLKLNLCASDRGTVLQTYLPFCFNEL